MKNARPNVLLIITDEQRCDSLGCYGSPWASSPGIDALAADACVFTEAITPSPLCVPARTSMMSGQYPHVTGCFANPGYHNGTTPHLLGPFKDAGYRTVSYGKHHYRGWPSQKIFDISQDIVLSDLVGYTSFSDSEKESSCRAVKYPSPYTRWLMSGDFPGAIEDTAEFQVSQAGIDFITNHSSETDLAPFFLRLSYNAPHTPVVPPKEYLDRIDPSGIDIPGAADIEKLPVWLQDYLWEYSRSNRFSDSELRTIQHSYYANSTFLDELIHRVLQTLRETGYIDNTIVVIVSDHGTHLGDHGFVQKQTFFDSVSRVPYLLYFPKKIAYGYRHEPVSTVSLFPTLLDLADLPVPQELLHNSLADSLSDPSKEKTEPVFGEYTLDSIQDWGLKFPHRIRLVRHGDWKLCYCPAVPDEGQLFNVTEDPQELNNLFLDSSHREIRRNLQALWPQSTDEVSE